MTYASSAVRPRNSSPENDLCAHIETHLDKWLPGETEFPSGIHLAMRHAVLKGGKRLRSRLLILVAQAAQSAPLEHAEAALVLDAACAVELAHAASLVHDDMPCFDNAQLRRGQPTVHVAFGEPLAILTGDALLTLAFEVLSMAQPAVVGRAMRIVNVLARSIGTQAGMIGGQSLELDWNRPPALDEPTALCASGAGAGKRLSMTRYHHMKTGALFRAATEAGAMAVGVDDAQAWGQIGLAVGQLYQLTDDLFDVTASTKDACKPVGQDALHGRPNAALVAGLEPLHQEMRELLETLGQLVSQVAVDEGPLIGFIDELRAYTLGQPI